MECDVRLLLPNSWQRLSSGKMSIGEPFFKMKEAVIVAVMCMALLVMGHQNSLKEKKMFIHFIYTTACINVIHTTYKEGFEFWSKVFIDET